MAQQVAGFRTSAPHVWMATVCLALPSPARANLVSQAVQVCFATFWVAVPTRIWAPLAWRLTSVVNTSAHLAQAMAGVTVTAGAGEALRSFSIWRTLGEAEMPSLPAGLYWALTAVVTVIAT